MKTSDPFAGLSAFIAVADRASFSAAAEHLGMARATVGAQVRALEKRLGVRLLQRSTRVVTLTEAGTAYRAALAQLSQQVVEAEHAATAFQNEATGRLRISAPPDLGPNHLAPLIARYLATNPAVSVELSLSTKPVDLIAEGFDLAIRGALVVEPTMVTRQIGASALIVCAAPSYLARHGAPETPDDLAKHACLHFAGLRWGRTWQFKQKAVAFPVTITPRLECNDGPTLLAAAVEGAGIVLGPAFLVGPALRAGNLKILLPSWELPVVPVHAVFPATQHIAQKIRSFVDLLASTFSCHEDFVAGNEQSLNSILS